MPFKYLSNFWRTLDIALINSEINVILTWSVNCVLTSKVTRDADLDVPAITLSTENDKTLLEQSKNRI